MKEKINQITKINDKGKEDQTEKEKEDEPTNNEQ